MKFRRLKRILIWVFLIPSIVLGIALYIAYTKQDAIVQSQIESLNEEYKGKIVVGDVHLAPFKTFPRISLKIDDVAIFESKDPDANAIVDVADIYLGFRLWDVINGNYDIKTLVVEDGFIDYVVHEDGSTNLEHALDTGESTEEESPFHIHLKKVRLKNIAAHHLQEATMNQQEFLIHKAKGGFKSTEDELAVHVDCEFELNILIKGDTTYFRHKEFELHTDLTLNEETGILQFQSSEIKMADGNFELEGSIDTRNDMDLDLEVKGTKPNFDLFLAFAPEEVAPVLNRYKNKGEIYFNLSLKGPTTDARQPLFDATFGASEAFLENSKVKKRIDDLGFSGHFTNGEQRNLETMEFSLKNIKAQLETGQFVGNILVRNFKTPEIDMELDANFEIPFVAGFFNLSDISDTDGSVQMKLKFHDIIDMENPQHVLQDLNQAYYAELKVQDLSFNSDLLPAPLEDLDIELVMNGKQADLNQLDLKLGNSSISVIGWLTDLPAVVHHMDVPVDAHLEIKSDMLDLTQITEYSELDSSGIHEEIKDLSMSFSFSAPANAFTEFDHLPKGEFFIDDLHADLMHYPHELHDFHADIMVGDEDLEIIDFTGEIDDSDFHFNGFVEDYSAWMQEELNGDVHLDLTLRSDLLRFEDLFSYKGENFIPEDYRHEEIEALVIHMDSKMHYRENEMTGIELELDKLEGKMHVHPMKFEQFSAHVNYLDEHWVIKDLVGQIGRTALDVELDYYVGDDEAVKLRDNRFTLRSKFIDFDALTNFDLERGKEEQPLAPGASKSADVAEHAEAFNIYELPFTDMQFNIDVDHFIYHRLDFQDVKGQLRTTHDHFIHLDTLSLDAAGGHLEMNALLDGTDPEHIFIEPNMKVENMDLDKLLFKFENFGQDAIVSENLHGQLTADITGRIRLYPDMVADLDQSEVHLDAQVLNGRLENYDPMMMMQDYFGDKDLTSIRFDTLQNHMDITNGRITIPNMAIESTLGHMEISGVQNLNDSMEYFARIPWKMVKQATKNKIFGTRKDSTLEDEIIEVDETKNTKYLNLKITGTIEDFKVKLGKEKRKD